HGDRGRREARPRRPGRLPVLRLSEGPSDAGPPCGAGAGPARTRPGPHAAQPVCTWTRAGPPATRPGGSPGTRSTTRGRWRTGASQTGEPGIWKGGVMRKYVIMGVQGSGKGTQASLLAVDLDLVHISVGDIFRWHVQQHTKLGAQVRRVMAAGKLVGDAVAEPGTAERLTEHDWNYGFVIDGFPRNRRQAEFFLESYDIDGVIHLDLPDSEVRRRVLARRLCSGCGLDYNLITARPAEEGTCDVCGSTLVTREDATDEALAVRLRAY